MTRHVKRRTKPKPTFPKPMNEILGYDVPVGSTNCGWCATGKCHPSETSRGCINVQQRNVPITHRCPHQCPQPA